MINDNNYYSSPILSPGHNKILYQRNMLRAYIYDLGTNQERELPDRVLPRHWRAVTEAPTLSSFSVKHKGGGNYLLSAKASDSDGTVERYLWDTDGDEEADYETAVGTLNVKLSKPQGKSLVLRVWAQDDSGAASTSKTTKI